MNKALIQNGKPKSPLACPIAYAIRAQFNAERVIVGYTRERKIWIDGVCYKGTTEKDQKAIETFITRFDSPFLTLGIEYENGFKFTISPI